MILVILQITAAGRDRILVPEITIGAIVGLEAMARVR
jgi:hypothetical protein